MLDNLALGFATATTASNLLYCFLGTFIGVLPGLGPLAAVAMLLPVSFYLPPETALVMLAGVYYGAEYGGSIASILLNIPGTPSSSITCLDGYPMAREGRAGVALLMTALASFFGRLRLAFSLVRAGVSLLPLSTRFESGLTRVPNASLTEGGGVGREGETMAAAEAAPGAWAIVGTGEGKGSRVIAAIEWGIHS